jgi:hypothetical protein
MALNKISMRLQTPPDETGNRKDIHIVTTSDEVIVNPDSSSSMTLTERLGHGEVQITDEKPSFPCIWAQPVTTTTE